MLEFWLEFLEDQWYGMLATLALVVLSIVVLNILGAFNAC